MSLESAELIAQAISLAADRILFGCFCICGSIIASHLLFD